MNAVKVVTTVHQHRTVEILLEVMSVLVKMAMKYQLMDLLVLLLTCTPDVCGLSHDHLHYTQYNLIVC